MSDLVPQAFEHSGAAARVPALVAEAGNQAALRYLEFFAAQIRNPNTRDA